IDREERTPVDRLVKQAVARNALQLQRGDESGAGDLFCLLREILQHVSVGSRPGDSGLRSQETQPRRAPQSRFKVVHIRLADSSLFGKALQLRAENRRLKFAKPVIESNQPMAEFIGHACAPRVDVRLHALKVLEIICNDGAALAASDQLAGLKAESAQIPNRPGAF